jgi:7-cyano-7-deazaguanine synthase
MGATPDHSAHAAAPGTALVLFSGGQDSTVCLTWALAQPERFARVETVAFDYGQRHRVELEQRVVVLSQIRAGFPDWTARLGDDHLLDLSVLGAISDCALTDDRAFEMTAAGLPNTFVPGRNLMFLTLAAALAYRRGADTLVGGMCETDYSGYPDCRDETLRAQQQTLTLGLGRTMVIATPLMWIDKAQTWALTHDIGGEKLVDLVVEHTHTCYLGRRDRRFDWGRGCGECPACQLRADGWRRWQAGAAATPLTSPRP